MTKKKLFNSPDSQEREYVRVLLSYSRELQANINKIVIPNIGNIKREYQAESRADGWADSIDNLIGQLAILAAQVLGIYKIDVVKQFIRVNKFNDREFRKIIQSNLNKDILPMIPLSVINEALVKAASGAGLIPKFGAGSGIIALRNEPWLAPLADGWISQNVSLLRSIPERLHGEVEVILRQGIMNGDTVDKISKSIKDRFGVTDSRAKIIAQDQTLKLDSALTTERLESVGVTEFIWRTKKDSKVRSEDRQREGKVYSIKRGDNGVFPGQQTLCRCRQEPVFETMLSAA